MRRPTPREWRRLWEPLAWVLFLPVVAKTLGVEVALVVAVAGLTVHGVAWTRSVLPGSRADTAQVESRTPLEGALAHLAVFFARRRDLGRLLAMASMLTALALRARYGPLVFVLPVLVVALLMLTSAKAPPARRRRQDSEPADPSG